MDSIIYRSWISPHRAYRLAHTFLYLRHIIIECQFISLDLELSPIPAYAISILTPIRDPVSCIGLVLENDDFDVFGIQLSNIIILSNTPKFHF